MLKRYKSRSTDGICSLLLSFLTIWHIEFIIIKKEEKKDERKVRCMYVPTNNFIRKLLVTPTRILTKTLLKKIARHNSYVIRYLTILHAQEEYLFLFKKSSGNPLFLCIHISVCVVRSLCFFQIVPSYVCTRFYGTLLPILSFFLFIYISILGTLSNETVMFCLMSATCR